MHVLYLHPSFPAQFGQVAAALAVSRGYRCTYLSEAAAGTTHGIELVQYRVRGGPTQNTHFCARTFENVVWHSTAACEALANRPDLRPDLIVAHSGMVSALFLRELYPDCPVINYFEFYYHTSGSDLDFFPDAPPTIPERMRVRARNANILLDLEHCTAGYSPTRWQRDLLPPRYRSSVQVIYDGVDTMVWRPFAAAPRQAAGRTIPPGTRIVTYVAQGFERLRGFDVFLQLAKRLVDSRPDVVVLVVGADRLLYGTNRPAPEGVSFKDWVLSRLDVDLSRIWFLGMLPPQDLARILQLSDLHVYLTAPFVLSWSVMNALACGATVLGSDTGPVREVIEDGRTGLLAEFANVDQLFAQASRVLDDPAAFKPLGEAATEMVREKYSLHVCVPQHARMYEEAAALGPT